MTMSPVALRSRPEATHWMPEVCEYSLREVLADSTYGRGRMSPLLSLTAPSLQEYFIIPTGAATFEEAMRIGTECKCETRVYVPTSRS